MLPAMHLRRFWPALAISLALALAACTQIGPGGPQGTLVGDVVAGPTCPVERAGNPCPPRPVPNRRVTIEAPGGDLVTTVTTDAQGHFTVHLAPGHYVVRVAIISGQVGLRQVTPGDVIIVAGQTTFITIELDTGIR